MAKKIGIIAGWGRFPIVVAESLKTAGYEVYCLGIRNHVDPQLKEICDVFGYGSVGRLGPHIRFFRNHGVTKATMAGKIFKSLLFEKYWWFKNFPDLTFWRFFYPLFVSSKGDSRDDSILLAVTRMYDRYGIEFAPATNFAPELLVKEGILTSRRISAKQMNDVAMAWNVAKEMGRLDIGQSIVVAGQTVLAVEAVEGTDECIRRAGQLCPRGGFTVVKVAKPQQDMRFDVPTIGVGTLKTIADSGGTALVIEAEKTIVLDQKEMVSFADQHGIAIIVATNGKLNGNLVKAA